MPPILVGLQTEGSYDQWLHYLLFECRKHLSWGAHGFYFLIQLLDDFKSGTLFGIYIYWNWIKKTNCMKEGVWWEADLSENTTPLMEAEVWLWW